MSRPPSDECVVVNFNSSEVHPSMESHLTSSQLVMSTGDFSCGGCFGSRRSMGFLAINLKKNKEKANT